jgi:hypothetical protein
MGNVVTKVCAVAGSTVVLMARLKKSDDTYVVPNDVTSVRVDAYEDLYPTYAAAPLTPYGNFNQTIRTPVNSAGVPITDGSAYATPAVSSVVFNTPQTDSRWELDSTGYNVAYTITAPVYHQQLDVRITFTLTTGDTLVLAYLIDAA